MKRILTMAAALVLAAPAQAAPVPNQPGRYAPRDTCGQLPGAAAFRALLTRAVARRDAVAFSNLASPRVALDFGGGEGRAELRRRLAGHNSLILWSGIDEILALGCGRDRRAMVFPWVFTQDIGDLDVFSVYVVKGAGVPLYAKASRNARVLNRLSWQYVEQVGENNQDAAFQRVVLVGTSQRGFIETSRLRSVVDLRMHIEQVGGVWRITSLVAGD